MQQRVPIKHFMTFPLALAAKEEMKVKSPDVTYQIRRNHDGFNLVRRYPVNAIQSFEEHYTKKRSGPSKRKRNRSIDGAFLSEMRQGSNR